MALGARGDGAALPPGLGQPAGSGGLEPRWEGGQPPCRYTQGWGGPPPGGQRAGPQPQGSGEFWDPAAAPGATVSWGGHFPCKRHRLVFHGHFPKGELKISRGSLDGDKLQAFI